MYLNKAIEGKYVDLKSICEDDAEFTLQIRQDPEFIRFLPKIKNSIEQQKTWIKQQQSMSDDYFWVVFDKKGNRIGTVGIFDIFANPPKHGRLALKGNALQNIEANYLAYRYGIYDLNLDRIWGFIYVENERAVRFAEVYGSILSEPHDYEGRLVREVIVRQPEFGEAEKKLKKMLYREKI